MTMTKRQWEHKIHYKLLRRGRNGDFVADGVRLGFAYRARVFDRYWRMFSEQL